jgi:alpha-beta hydrolase superfamily lysophospholipase
MLAGESLMPEPTYLDLVTEDGNRLRHKYFQHEEDPKGLVVLLPGDNYGVDGPLLYFPGHWLWSLGWDTAAITYGYQSAGKMFSPLAIADVLAESQRAIQNLLSERKYKRLVLIGKSLGAALVGLLCQQMKLPSWTRAVYLTPPLGPMFNPIFLETTPSACIALGTSDRFFDESVLRELEGNKSFDLIKVEKADHSMNIPDDLEASLAALRKVTKGILEFVTSGDEVIH